MSALFIIATEAAG